MSQNIYYSVRIAAFYDQRPADWFPFSFGPYLKIGSITTTEDKYEETTDSAGTLSDYGFDFWEMGIGSVTFTKPVDFDTATITLTGKIDNSIIPMWGWTTVPDGFVIPSQFDTTGLF